jgi:hypothetical protein
MFKFNPLNGKLDITNQDNKVSVDSAATHGYLGAASNDGVLRTSSNLTYTDGGDFVTLDIASVVDLGNNSSLATDEVKAYDSAGLKLYDDGGNGIFVQDGGNVGIGTTPSAKLDIKASTNDGSTDGLRVLDSDDAEVFTVDSNGKIDLGNYGMIQQNGLALMLSQTARNQPLVITTGGNKGATLQLYGDTDSSANYGRWKLFGYKPLSDVAPGISELIGVPAKTTASTNINGGNITITAGDGATASAGDADGGDVLLDGGIGYGTGSDGNILLQTTQGGNIGIGTDSSPDTKLDVNGAITQRELSADPADPDEGSNVTWQSDGTGSGSDGDIMCKINAGGVVKTVTLVDFSLL